jgi:hypothetical protein
MQDTELTTRFLESLRFHGPIEDWDPDESLDVCAEEYTSGLLAAAGRVLARQAIARQFREVEALLNTRDAGAAAVLDRESNVAMLLALFIAGREGADGGVQLRAGTQVVGDHIDGLSEVQVEVGVRRGDFTVEFLVTWDEFGPNPAHRDDESQPTGLEMTYELALIRDQAGPKEPPLSDRKTRRIGLESLGPMVETYEDSEAERDPFGVAARVFKRLQRRLDDDFTA